LLEGGASYASGIGVWSARIAQEVLGSDDGSQGFQTPYATKHAFNGWADMFLNTPTAGLDDRYVTLAGDLQPFGIKLQLMYHRYSAEEGSADFGDEWNAQVVKQFGPKYSIGMKYASYEADADVATLIGTTANIDTRKFWVPASDRLGRAQMRGGVHGNGARGGCQGPPLAANPLRNTEKASLAQLMDYLSQRTGTGRPGR
jgi:hypothetical protein